MSYPQMEKEVERNGREQEEGLRLLARIIARIYAHDTQKQSEMRATATIAKRRAKQHHTSPVKAVIQQRER